MDMDCILEKKPIEKWKKSIWCGTEHNLWQTTFQRWFENRWIVNPDPYFLVGEVRTSREQIGIILDLHDKLYV